MIRLGIALLIITTIVGSCKQGSRIGSRKVPGYVNDRFSHIVRLAWNEDPVLPWQFSLFDDNSFLYTISRREGSDGRVNTYSYQGKVKDASDTIFLEFKGRQPKEKIARFMVKEMSGSYLIQYFTDTTQRFFFRYLVMDRHGYFW